MTHLLEAVADVTGTRDRDVMDVSIVHVLQDALALSAVRLVRIDDETGEQRLVASALPDHAIGAEDDLDLAWEGVEAEVLRERCLASGDIERAAAVGGGHLAVFPLRTQRRTVGFVEVETPLPLAEQAERLVGGMLRIYRNHMELLDYGERDQLTGLLNRKTFEDAFARRVSAEAGGYWLGVVDIDHFKSVNDRFGHLIGDEVLLLVAGLLKDTFRASDRLFRFGGEEFVILLDSAAPALAADAFERFRARVEAHAFPQVGRVTVSIGYTAIGPDDTSARAFERADHAVYYAKQHGRNLTSAYESLRERGLVAEITAKSDDIELF